MNDNCNYGCRIKIGEKQYMDAFNEELTAFKDRIEARAHARIEAAMKEVEEVEHSASSLSSLQSFCACVFSSEPVTP